jgi:glycine cleavage system regulatory protein
MTIIGNDRPGLVRSIAKIIADQKGNWLDSRMCRLGGKFAGILRVHVPETNEGPLTQSLQELQSQGLTVVVHRDYVEHRPGKRKTARLSLVGHDRPGIIHHISTALAHQDINFEELETECSSAPMTGEPIFKAEARLMIPDSCVMSDLLKELEGIGSELMVEISFSET